MSDRMAAIITWGGAGLIGAAAVLTLVLTITEGPAVFAARLVSGLAGCL